MIPERITTIEAVDMAKSIMEKAERKRAEFAQRVADSERTGCSCCDPTSDSPDPVVQRLEMELEMERGRSVSLEHDVARYEAKWRDSEASNSRLRGLLREGHDNFPPSWEWRSKVTAALEGKP